MNSSAKIKQDINYKLLYERSPLGYQSLDAEGNFLIVNEAWAELLGYRPEEVIGRFFGDFMTEKSKAKVMQAFPNFKATGKVCGIEFEMLCKDDSIKVVSFDGRIGYDPEGNFRQTHCILQDLTAEKRAEVSEKNLGKIVEESFNEIYIISAETHKFLRVNRGARGNIGYTEEELHNLSPEVIAPAYDKKTFSALLGRLKKNPSKKITIDAVMKRKDGSLYQSESHVQLMSYGSGLALLAFVVDVTERKKNEDRLRALSQTVEQNPNLIVISDLKGNIEYANNRIVETSGYTVDEVVGKNTRLFGSGETPPEEYKELWETLSEGRVWHGTFHNKKKNGELYWARESIGPIKDENGKTTHYVAIQEDVTETKKLFDQLDYHASHDLLTGLINRREIESKVKAAVLQANQDSSKHVLCYLDLDQFKIINDTCTHIAGDELLKQFSKFLQGNVRGQDITARLGGDEFGILMSFCSVAQAKRVVEQLLEKVADFQFLWEDKIFRIGVSIGLVEIDENSVSVAELFRQADIACYAAKAAGRHRCHIYREDDEELAKRTDELQWVSRIHNGLENDKFVLYAQEIRALADGDNAPRHHELLIRLEEEKGEIIPPGAFLPAVERFHLSQKLDQWVIKTAFEWISRNKGNSSTNTVFSLNISGPSFGDQKLFDFIKIELERTQLNAAQICFEVTETAAINNLSQARVFIESLKEHGFLFALDDFGSGLSSFEYLKNLPVDYLKIDGQFVKDIETDPIDLAMLKSINDIGHVMGKKTIAEFVENGNIMKMLEELKVDFAQGYHLGRPIPLDELDLF